MKLVVIWLNPTRPHEDVVRIEQTYRDTLLNFFNGVECAKKAKDNACKIHSPYMDWQRANSQAALTISELITPTEYTNAKFIVEFH